MTAGSLGVAVLAIGIASFAAGEGFGPGADGPWFVALALVVIAAGFVERRTSWSKPARNLELSAAPAEPRRGQAISVSLEVTRPPSADAVLEVGLVCSEIYDYQERTYRPTGSSTVRSTRVIDAYAEWAPAQATGERQQLAFTVPSEAPYSYEGDCISYAWRVCARQRRRFGRSPVRELPIWVLP